MGWALMGASLLTFIASFFNFWSISSSIGGYGGGISGWSLWWWIPILLSLAVGVVYALQALKIVSIPQIQPVYLVYGGAGAFVLMIFVLIHTFVRGAGLGFLSAGGVSSGPGFGVWFALITTLALAYLTALYAQSTGAKLPFKVPGPDKF